MRERALSVLYIVKDEAEYLPYSLRSVHEAADEVVVVDGYSSDGTDAVARAFPKVRLLRSRVEDYAALRNLALAASVGRWVMPMDADMVFYADAARRIPQLVASDADAYYSYFFHLMRDFGHVQNVADRDERYRRWVLIRRTAALHWEGAVHEHPVGVGPRVLDAGIFFVHYGYVKPPRAIFRRWEKYARLEGDPDRYAGVNPDTILDDRPVRPFTREHPEAIREFVRRKEDASCGRGSS